MVCLKDQITVAIESDDKGVLNSNNRGVKG
jgi:hypothetical protein